MGDEHRAYYAVIPANVRYDTRLKAGAKLLYGEITALTNERGYCWATNDYFAKLYDVTKGTISRLIQQLNEYKYLDIEYVYDQSKAIKERRIRLADNPPTVKNDCTPTVKIDGSPTVKIDRDNNKYLILNNIFEVWKKLTNHPRAKLDQARKSKISARLAEGFSEDDLILAINGLVKSNYHMGENDNKTRYDGINVVFRNAERVEHFMNLATETKTSMSRSVPQISNQCDLCTPEQKCKFHDKDSAYNKKLKSNYAA